MKFVLGFVLAVFSAFASAQPSAESVSNRLLFEGDPWFSFATTPSGYTDCINAVPTLGDSPKVRAKVAAGAEVFFDCTTRVRFVAAEAPPIVTQPPVTACVPPLSDKRTVEKITAMAKPFKGVQFAEPNFKTCAVRATDHVADGMSGFAHNDYSRRQAFNADSTKQLVASLNGYWHLYDTSTHAHLKQLPGPAGDAEIQWHPTNPNLMYYMDSNGIGMKVYELNVVTGAKRTVGDLGARLKARWPDAMAAWTGSEGSPSADGRYWCFKVEGDNWVGRGVVTWDMQTDTITGYLNTNRERPDHVSMSPSGKYCVIGSDGSMGTVSYTRDFSASKKILKLSQHSDLALDAAGDDVYVAIDYQSDAGDVFMFNLRTGVRTPLITPGYIDGTSTAMHFSGKAFNKPGWVAVSAYSEGGGAAQWFHRKIMAVQLSANPKIYNLAFHRSGYSGYWTAPTASVNRDFTKVVFNSNWGNGSDTDVDTYVVDIPAGTLK